jgi:hypothetical protein
MCLLISVFSQTEGMAGPSATPPKEETFAPSTELVMPSRSFHQTCDVGTVVYKRDGDDCPIPSRLKLRDGARLSLYGADGKLWHILSVYEGDPEYFLKSEIPRLIPLGPAPIVYLNGNVTNPDLIILRVVAESNNWYEVEVNESTHETKYVLKSDRLWKTTTWSGILYMSHNVFADPLKTKFRDKPEGSIIPECDGQTRSQLFVLEVKGDWVRVRSGQRKDSQTSCEGWIKWRNGREILVGSILNGMKIPETK